MRCDDEKRIKGSNLERVTVLRSPIDPHHHHHHPTSYIPRLPLFFFHTLSPLSRAHVVDVQIWFLVCRAWTDLASVWHTLKKKSHPSLTRVSPSFVWQFTEFFLFVYCIVYRVLLSVFQSSLPFHSTCLIRDVCFLLVHSFASLRFSVTAPLHTANPTQSKPILQHASHFCLLIVRSVSLAPMPP